MADASIWSAIVTMLATLEFNAAKDEDGKDVVFEATFTSGLSVSSGNASTVVDRFPPRFSYSTTFPCRLTPRAHMNEVLKISLSDGSLSTGSFVPTGCVSSFFFGDLTLCVISSTA